ncbi:phage holin family protein [Paenibacillus sp. CAU 1782]
MDALAKVTIAVGGAIASYLFGGWSIMLSILLTFVIIDYCTGLAAAAKEGKLRSDVGLWGIAKKVMIFGIVTVAHLIDTALGEAHLFRDTAIFFYLSNELLSFIENAGRIGAPIPPALQKAVEVLKSKSGENPFGNEAGSNREGVELKSADNEKELLQDDNPNGETAQEADHKAPNHSDHSGHSGHTGHSALPNSQNHPGVNDYDRP